MPTVGNSLRARALSVVPPPARTHHMATRDVPDPLKPGNIPGQNPATPERMPGHTAAVASETPAEQGNEEELGGRPAFLFRAGEWRGVTLDSSGQNLPKTPPSEWQLERYFTLGVRDAVPGDINPEQIIRGVRASGYFVWRTTNPSRFGSTTQ